MTEGKKKNKIMPFVGLAMIAMLIILNIVSKCIPDRESDVPIDEAIPANEGLSEVSDSMSVTSDKSTDYVIGDWLEE